MQKIMFDDKHGLTEAVLEGRKTMTRRIAEKVLVEDIDQHLVWTGEFKKPKYKVGEVVAVAQKYWDLRDCGAFYEAVTKADPSFPIECIEGEKGCHNKMFVRAEWMPHQIRITNVRVERLQDITDEDCLREGIIENTVPCQFGGIINNYTYEGAPGVYVYAWEAFSALINRICGKGTWDSNPWVFVYEFELVK